MAGLHPFRRGQSAKSITYGSEYQCWFSLFLKLRKQRKGKRMFLSTIFSTCIFLYSTIFLKAEEWSKPGLLLFVKGGISSLTLQGFWHFCFYPVQQWRLLWLRIKKIITRKLQTIFSKKSDILLLVLGLQPHIFPINFEVK